MHTYKMKQTLILIAVVGALCGVVLSSSADDNERIQTEKRLIQKFNYQAANSIGKYDFPLTVSSFVKDLGQPDSTFTDDNESCPVGQIHTWCLRSQNLKIIVLGDVYKPKVDYSVESRLFAVAKCGSGTPTGFGGLWGIQLGDSEKDVNQRLSEIQKQKKNVALKRNIKGTPLHVLLNGFPVSHHHSMNKDNLFFYFVINNQGRLEVIIQSTFDLSIAC